MGARHPGRGPVPVDADKNGLGSLGSLVQERALQGCYPGAVFAVARGSRVLELSAVGIANIDTKASMRTDSIFRQMSSTKPITAALAMMLVEEGKLKLDAPVSATLSEFATFGVPGGPPLTLRHLLTHTSGIGFGSIPTTPTTLAERARNIATRSVTARAGKDWAYSGYDGPDVVARMVEVAAGEPFDRFAKRRLFDPLGMKDTTWALTPAQEQRLVGLYAAKNGSVAHTAALLPPTLYPSGGAGLCSTVPDYLRFVQMLAGNGTLDRVRVLSSASVEEMRRKQLPAGFPGLPPGNAAGLLMRYVDDPTAAKSPLPAGAYGWSGAYGTHFWIDPTTGLAAVWMINLTTAGGAGSPDALEFEQMVTRACQADSRCGTR